MSELSTEPSGRERERGPLAARRFLVSALDGQRAPRLAPALNALRARLIAEDGWLAWNEAAGVMAAASSDLQPATVSSKIHQLVQAGIVVRRGRWHRSKGDSRMIRLVDWPLPERESE